jgi:membrane-associated phospholipid phosphatase
MSHSTVHFPPQTDQETILKFNNPYQPDQYSFSSHEYPALLRPEEEKGIIAEDTGIRTFFGRIVSDIRNVFNSLPIQLMDINCLIFLIVISTILLFFHGSVPDWKIHYLTHILYILFILFNITVIRRQKHNRFLMAFRLLYPAPIILFAWNELTYLIPMIYGNYWATDWITTADKFLFGVHPTLWFQKWYRPWLDELMNLCYSSYYLYMPLILLALFYKKRYNDLSQVLSIATWTFLGKFLFYYLLPVLGPRMIPELQSLSFREYSGFFIDRITRMFQSGSGIVGGAFPSSHVGGGVMWTLVSLKYFKKAGLFMIPFTLGMTVATVYLGYHHALDAIAGLLWGIVSFIVVSNWNSRIKWRGDRRLKMKDERRG